MKKTKRSRCKQASAFIKKMLKTAEPPIKEVQELTELDTTIMTTSTNKIYCGGHLLGMLPWAEEDAL